jgi:chromosome segregation protein
MRLQRLEIAGFKSFLDRAELAFDQGVTAIVGPNGCGKSNVADAIMWVLGEQSAKSLRGDRMEDVIFNGSDARKPTAAAEVRLLLGGVRLAQKKSKGGEGVGAAPPEVQLDLDDEIAREVEVTRRLYRSGESEYLINGEVVRLRDVHDLLMDTGLGAKAYAIIEQGKIGQILSGKPTDRRQIIEEAAGVTKYKARRRAAELKLEASQQNLTRIDDIVFEVEKQRNQLKRQAARARRYRRLRDELRGWEKLLFARRYRALASTIESTRAALRTRRQEETRAVDRLAAVERELGELRARLGGAESEATATRERAHACEIEIDRREGQIALASQQIEALEVRADELAQEIRELEDRRAPLAVAVEEAAEASGRSAVERTEAEAALRADTDAYNEARARLEGLEGDVEAARKEVYTAISAVTALRHAIEGAMQARERVLDTLGRLQAEASDLAVDLEKVQGEREAASAGLRRAQEDLEVTGRDRAAREAELVTARSEHERRVREMRSREQEIAGARARLRSLEELEAGRVAYGEASRLVLQASGLPHHGSVADYLEVDRRFERAIEACLGELLEHVVVDDHETARRGVEFAREQAAGRCGFVIGADQSPVGDAQDLPAGATAFDAVAQVTGPYAASIRAAVGRVWIAESFAAARQLVERDRTIVTADGDVFSGRAVVQGGVKGEARGILATKREIKELRERIDRDEEAIRVLAGEIQSLEATIGTAAEAVAALTAEQHRQEKAIVGLELQVSRAAEEQQRIERKRDLLRTEIRRAEEERFALEQRESEARSSIVRIEEEQRSAEEELAAAQRRLADAREVVEVLSRRMGETRASYAALTERASALLAEVERLQQTSRELEARLATRSNEIAQATSRREELARTVVEQEEVLERDRAALERVKADVLSADERVMALRAESEAQEALIREARGDLEAVRAAVNELEVARAKAENDLTHLATACLESLQASLDEVTAEAEAMVGPPQSAPEPSAREDEADEEGAEREEPLETAATDLEAASAEPEAMIIALKAKIERLGPVNMMAIEQFDELEQRHEFLTVQRKDLIDSIAATGEAIRRIDETTKQRFREAFNIINETFGHTFRTLFGGGNAGLSLLDENDILESGIEIIAQPPGKRLQSIQLLSGGEKALTAIALMFSLFRYKPGPFCVLDEIDAPLDDANIGRFLEMLREMQENTQFILITHNRKTMEIADRLYGVTMEEPGVSKLISVRLN